MRVTPGSETLWSVQSGQCRMTWRLASSTSSWKRRSSRLGAGRAISVIASLFRNAVEGEHQVAAVVGSLLGILDIDVNDVSRVRVRSRRDVHDVDAWFPAEQRGPDLFGQLGPMV